MSTHYRSGRRFILGTGALALLLLVLIGHPTAQSPRPLVQPGQLVWDGAFRVPQTNTGTSTFGYGGWALAFDAARGGLYMVGHDYQQQVAEISIPAASKSTTIAGLPTATLLQTFGDVTEGRLKTIAADAKLGGLLTFGGRLIATGWSYFDANNTATASHFTHSPVPTQTGTVTGPHLMGPLKPGFYGGFMAEVPSEWQAALGGPALTGQCCVPIITRTSFGPSAHAFDPSQLGVAAEPIPTQPLVYYPELHKQPDGDWASDYTNFFNLSTQMGGMFIPSGTKSLLYVGRQGQGKKCYRCTDPDPYCADSMQAPPYRLQVWAYNLDDLAAVKAGSKQAWDVRPYAIWPLTGDLNPIIPHWNACMYIKGLAHDPATGRIWVAAYHPDGDFPVIHQFHVDTGVTAPPVDCKFTVSPTAGVKVPAAGGSFSLTLTPSDPVCQWRTAQSSGPTGGWVSFSPTSGTGQANVTVTATANTTGSLRTTFVFAGSRTVDVTQAASGLPAPGPAGAVRIY